MKNELSLYLAQIKIFFYVALCTVLLCSSIVHRTTEILGSTEKKYEKHADKNK